MMKVWGQTLGQKERRRHREGMEEMANEGNKVRMAYYRAKTVLTVPNGEQTHFSSPTATKSFRLFLLCGCIHSTSVCPLKLYWIRRISAMWQPHELHMLLKMTKISQSIGQKDNDAEKDVISGGNAALTLASLSPVGQISGTILKTLLVFCALKKRQC